MITIDFHAFFILFGTALNTNPSSNNQHWTYFVSKTKPNEWIKIKAILLWLSESGGAAAPLIDNSDCVWESVKRGEKINPSDRPLEQLLSPVCLIFNTRIHRYAALSFICTHRHMDVATHLTNVPCVSLCISIISWSTNIKTRNTHSCINYYVQLQKSQNQMLWNKSVLLSATHLRLWI